MHSPASMMSTRSNWNGRFACSARSKTFQQETNARGIAVRCWPETFTEYGCAACGPMAMMNQKRVYRAPARQTFTVHSRPCCCRNSYRNPTWMADLVDLDFRRQHRRVLALRSCPAVDVRSGQATPEATIHTNRKMPLLHQFPLKPGEFTVARLSQSRNETKLVIGLGEFVRAPMAFTGTSGVFRFSADCAERLRYPDCRGAGASLCDRLWRSPHGVEVRSDATQPAGAGARLAAVDRSIQECKGGRASDQINNRLSLSDQRGYRGVCQTGSRGPARCHARRRRSPGHVSIRLEQPDQLGRRTLEDPHGVVRVPDRAAGVPRRHQRIDRPVQGRMASCCPALQ